MTADETEPVTSTEPEVVVPSQPEIKPQETVDLEGDEARVERQGSPELPQSPDQPNGAGGQPIPEAESHKHEVEGEGKDGVDSAGVKVRVR